MVSFWFLTDSLYILVAIVSFLIPVFNYLIHIVRRRFGVDAQNAQFDGSVSEADFYGVAYFYFARGLGGFAVYVYATAVAGVCRHSASFNDAGNFKKFVNSHNSDDESYAMGAKKSCAEFDLFCVFCAVFFRFAEK
jgi:hypothetical protein